MTREPSPSALYAARLARAYPSLSAYSAASLAHELDAIERAQHRHAERCCNGADGGYVRKKDFAKLDVFDGKAPRGTTEWRREPNNGRWIVEHDPEEEARAGERIEKRAGRWLSRLFDLSMIREGTVDKRTLRFAARMPTGAIHNGEPVDDVAVCAIDLQDDPRGRVLLLQLPFSRDCQCRPDGVEPCRACGGA